MHAGSRIEPPAGMVSVRAAKSYVEHWAPAGAQLTLCGYVALYKTRYMPGAAMCRRCQWEAAQRPPSAQ